MITHFYADPHFGHVNIIEHADRPFGDVGEMDAELERRYCATVSIQDVVLWVGDVAFARPEWTAALLARLPGRKLLVRGNHDGTVAHCLRLGFEFVTDALYLLIAGHKVTVSHYPPLPRDVGFDERYVERRPPKPGPGEFVLHGHTHERERRIGRRIHVGVDAWDYGPASMARVAALIESEVR